MKGIIFLILLFLLIAFFDKIGVFLLILLSIYFVYAMIKYVLRHVKHTESDEDSDADSDEVTSDSFESPLSDFQNGVVVVENVVPAENTSDSKNKINTPHENHNVAGTSFRQKEIASLGDYNFEYEQTKKEIVENYFGDEKIYELTFNPFDVQLVEEPDNEYDPNAIKVVIDGIHVGYIKKGSCSHIKKLISSQRIQRITADIHGGKYKNVYSTFDDEKMDDIIHVESGRSDYFVSICIYLKE